MEKGVLEHCETALQTFTGIGCHVEPLAPPMPAEQLWKSWITLRAFANAARLQPLYDQPDKRKLLPPQAIWEIEKGRALSAMDIQRASATRSQWFATAETLLQTYDALILPTAQLWPFPLELPHPTAIGPTEMDTYHRWMEVVIPASLIGLPSLGLPAGFNDKGLPMGLQLIGRYKHDLRVLQLGQAWHKATQWPQTRPPPL